LYHIDCYRLKNEIDFLNIGGEELLTQDDGITLIEWADIINKILPSNVITIKFSMSDGYPNSRQIEIIGILDED
jgi:tRNA threonylcarbamoyladenosine biosynthesis protein TsaE